MKRSEIILMILKVPLDLFMLILAGISAYYLRFSDWAIGLKPVIFELTLLSFVEITSWVAVVWILIFALTGLYSTDPNRKLSRDLTRILLACSAGLSVVALYIMFAQLQFDSRFLVAAGWGFSVVYVAVGRIFMRGVKGVLYRLGIGLRKVVVIGSENLSGEIINSLEKRKELGYRVVGHFNNFSRDIKTKLEKLKFDEMIFINPRADEKETLAAMNFCDQRHRVFKYSADLFSAYSANMVVSPLAGVPVVELKKTPLDGWGRVAKRIFDIIMGIFVIIVTSPIMLLSTLIILMETGRPVIYKNERVGIRGHKFFTLKFRSMFQKDSTGSQFGKAGEKAQEAEKELIKKQSTRKGPIYKIADDPRVTKFGRFIRRWSVDELPQFFNVLKGEMSIVGPRPHQPREVEKYEEKYRKVFTLKPGITGLAQISGRSDLDFEEEMKLDVFYIEKWSLLLDVIIFVKTPFILFKRRKVL
ncbi:MAG: sugar transferase [Candidatus Magasanikbacteria bacterium]|jgi:exopolysaccharide biosynthesis polyprenyl glycosylphosphotransferase|nr:sugar transferase [Candidatus Magasanikbacteria bacterium]MBT4315250.1 sugar transferase [Candidatus Magasanikbacteria bacterium]MBT4547104.1 sugar transferase [Candidatus Magasanikbacteria bacterium]MBT6819609.1 sugar transferase [Candidatus Magasanikbacteria bacterium]